MIPEDHYRKGITLSDFAQTTSNLSSETHIRLRPKDSSLPPSQSQRHPVRLPRSQRPPLLLLPPAMARAQAGYQLRPRQKSQSDLLPPRARRRQRHPALGHADHAAPARRPNPTKDSRPSLLRPADRLLEPQAHELRARNQERNRHRPEENRGNPPRPAALEERRFRRDP